MLILIVMVLFFLQFNISNLDFFFTTFTVYCDSSGHIIIFFLKDINIYIYKIQFKCKFFSLILYLT